MTMGRGQQLLATGVDNASCLAFRESLALGTWGFSRCLGDRHCPWKFLVQGGCPQWLGVQGWLDRRPGAPCWGDFLGAM